MTSHKDLRYLGAALVVAMLPLLTSTFVPAAWATSNYKTLYKFKSGADGGYTRASLIFNQDGNLYGTTAYGGSYGYGTVLELIPNGTGGWTESVLYSFQNNGTDGNTPFGGLIFDSVGNLYGTTAGGGAYGNYGAVFELTSTGGGSWTESILHSFSGKDGYEPYTGNLVFDKAGNLYGTTLDGGDSASGVAFELTPNGDGTWTENLVQSFSIDYGIEPAGGLIFDEAGSLYGTTFSGGAQSGGTAFKIVPQENGTWTEKVIYAFGTSGSTGTGPQAGLILDGAGNLYGTTSNGGVHNSGVVFELIRQKNGSWAEQVLHAFNCSGKDGCDPYASLTFDKAGNLYGTTFKGGSHGYGVVFKLAPNGKGGWTESVLHSFANRPGAYPWSSVTFDTSGNLYGTTAGTDDKTNGSVFEITP